MHLMCCLSLDGQTGVVSEEIISQLVDEAIEIESQTKKNEEERYFLSSVYFTNSSIDGKDCEMFVSRIIGEGEGGWFSVVSTHCPILSMNEPS